MHLLTSLIIVIGFAFVLCLGLVKMIRDLSQLSSHESPAIRETPRDTEAADDTPAQARPALQRNLP
jgi:hypothetical protein